MKRMKTIFDKHYLTGKFFSIIFLFAVFASGQNIPNDQNYIMSVELLEPMTSVNMDNLNVIPDAHKKVSITYYDGLGREKQSILHKATPTNKDIVTKYEYDNFGRQLIDYLPAPTEQITGTFIPDPTSDYNSYYAGKYSTQAYFSKKTMDNSPLNRIMKQAAPGTHWAEGAGHEIEFAYYSNSATEVDLYWIDPAGNLRKGNYKDNDQFDFYPAKSLSRVITKDENGNRTYEYKDKQGRVVLTRSYVEFDDLAGKTDPSSNINEKVDTYYVYDLYGNLVYVVPPKAAAMASQGTVATAIVTGLCYTYMYDHRNRMTDRRLPGKGWEYMVYDQQNRLVATQDAEMAKNTFTLPSGAVGKAWAFTKYDKFGRVVYTGLYKNTQTRAQIQSLVNGFGNNSESVSSSFTQNGITLYHTKSGAFPKNHTESDSDILTVNYYDSYTSAMLTADGVTLPAAAEGQTVRSGGSTSENSLKAMPVASHVRVLPSEGWERVYTFYDNRSRPVRTHKVNHLGGHTRTDSKLKFRGMPEYTKSYHKRSSSQPQQVILKDNFTYDNQERLKSHTQIINNYSQNEQLIAYHEYDLLGQLDTKKVGGKTLTGTDRWQEIKYKYNIRGWLTDINNVGTLMLGKDAVPPTPTDALFSFKILYNQLVNGAGPYGEELYNGNIAQTLWKTASDNKLRGYVYSYDQLNRMTDAVFYKQDSNPFVGTYNEHLAYDVSGNITSLKRSGGYETQTLPDAMDILSYSYAANTNKLMKVADDGQKNTGFIDSPTNTTNDYAYDSNGNMTSDKNKNITSIKYNHLSLPTEITFGDGNSIQYFYNAAGQKVKKIVGAYTVTTGNPYVKQVDYLDGFQYTGEELNFFPHAEGYVNVTLGTTGNRIFNYVYNYTDHLGNIRLSYTKDMVDNKLKILDENHYYPFGLKHQKYTAAGSIGLKAIDETTARPGNLTSTPYAYKYNGQEWQDELGLNMYDMDMRQYDPAIARWVVMDPVIHHSMSPYNSFDNNPVFWADPSGADSAFNNLGESVASLSDMHGNTIVSAGGKGNSKSSSSQTSDKSPIGGVSAEWTAEDSAQFPGDDSIPGAEELSPTGIVSGNDSYNDGAMMGAVYEAQGRISSHNNKTGTNYFNQGMWGAAVYGDYIHNHKTYKTTKGVVRDIYKNGKPISRRAANYAKVSKLAKGLGVAGFGIGLAIDVRGVFNYYDNPNSSSSVHPAKAGLNTTMGALGFTVWGTPASMLYGTAEAFHPQGAEGALRDYGEVQNTYRQHNDGAVFKAGL